MINAHEERTTRHCKNIEGKLFKGNSKVIQENVIIYCCMFKEILVKVP